jgi:hypothetical protein
MCLEAKGLISSNFGHLGFRIAYNLHFGPTTLNLPSSRRSDGHPNARVATIIPPGQQHCFNFHLTQA